MQEAGTEEEYSRAVMSCEDLALLAGCMPYMNALQHKELLIASLCHFMCVGRAGMALDQ